MSEKYVKKVVEVERNELVALVCDVCGAQADGDEWAEGYFGKNSGREVDDSYLEIRTRLVYRDRESWGSEGEADSIKVDLCPACMRDKVIPFLRSIGMMLDIERDFF